MHALSKHTKTLSEEWIDGQQVMDILRIKRRALQNLRDNGIMPFSRFGGKLYYKVSDLTKLLESKYTCRGNEKPFRSS